MRFRQSLEESERLRLQGLLARRVAMLQELEQARQTSSNLQEETKRAMLQQPTPAIEIHFVAARLKGLECWQQLMREELLKLEAAIAEQRLRFEQERRQREVLEALRDAQLGNYRLMQRRLEQARLDEMHLLRRGHSSQA